MAPQDDVHFWLWVVSVATAVAAGLLALGATLQRRAAGGGPAAGSRMMLASYVCMSVSMLLFAARGFI